MRNSSIESLVIGCGVGMGVLLIHALTQGASAITQLLALLIVGVVLFCIQLALALRRARHGVPPPEQLDQPHPRSRPLRQRNSFARELTHDWIGLEDHSAERDLARSYAPDDLDDALWGEPPEDNARTPIAKLDEPRSPST